MLKVLLFALLAIGLGSCEDKIVETDELYASLLPEGGKPFFEIKNGEVPVKFDITREDSNALVFKVCCNINEATFEFNEKTYILYAFKIMFEKEGSAGLEIQFQQRNPTSAPTNIAIKTRITDDPDLKGEHGLEAQIVSANMVTYIMGNKKARQPDTVIPIDWIMESITAKKPMFFNLRRGPATLDFVLPPILVKADEFSKLRELKNKLKPSYTEQFYNLLAGSAHMVGASRRQSKE